MKTKINTGASVNKIPLVLTACLTAAVIPLSIAGPAVVVPSINQALGGSAIELSWVINAYILTYGSATMAAGSLADIHGRKKLWLLGLLLFAVVTAAIPYMPSVFWVDILRLIQGLGAAAAFAGSMAALTQEFEGYQRTRIFSLIGTTFGAGAAFGPFLAGLLIDTLGWPWVFWLPSLVALAASILVSIYARETRDPDAEGLDWPGAITFTLSLAVFTYGIILAPEKGWGNSIVLTTLICAVIVFIVFIVIERQRSKPMLDLSLFANARFVGVQLLAIAPAYAYVVLLVILPARFIGVEGYSALEAGQMMIALSAPLLIVPFIAGQLARWINVGVLSGLGLIIAAIGLFWLGYGISGDTTAERLWPMLVIGIGIGLPWGLMDGLAVSVVPKERAGMATGIFNAVRLAGDGIALAVVGAVLSAHIASGLNTQGSVPTDILSEISTRLAMSDLHNAVAIHPSLDKSLLYKVYEEAFRYQLIALAVAAAITAILVFILLGKVKFHSESK
ncbi:MFS transporter [Photorhabdus khanii]|uniref:MFS transporter n=1 Tax=Photorhabdus khanii TaxID=1004150 RepID=A0A7C9GMY7_9GAMM|nr:MFS transporter [Photorhabdus khanii]MQL50511.1 MFS transporter [Photorhabdus khanii]